MLLPTFEYHVPQTLPEAVNLLKNKSGSAILAGGTDVLPAMKNNLKDACGALISLGKIENLTLIQGDAKSGLRIGAMTKLGRVREKAETLIKEMPYLEGLAEACASVGAWQHREMGTIGGNVCLDTRCLYYNQPAALRNALGPCFKTDGNLCHVQKKSAQCMAVFSGDVAPALLVLNAVVDIFSNDGAKTVGIENIYSGDGKNPRTMYNGEVLTSINIPPQSGCSGSAYVKYRTRGSIDFPLVGVAAVVGVDENGICNQAGVAVTGIACKPVLLSYGEDLLTGKRLPDSQSFALVASRAYDEMHPLNNTKGSPYHRRNMIRFLIEKVLGIASKRALNYQHREAE